MQEIYGKVHVYIMTYGLNAIAAVLIFFVGKWLAGHAANLLEILMHKAKVDRILSSFAKNMTYMMLLAFVAIAALSKLGVQTTSLVALVGAAGLAVGLALQGSLANFAAGVILIIFKPFSVGDFVEAGGSAGTVEEVQIFNTILTAPDNRRIVVPNSKVTGDSITNFTGIGKRRIDLVFGISYGDDMKKAKETLLALVNSDPRVLKDPLPVVAVAELGDSSVNLVCRPWVKPADYWDVRFSMIEQGKTKLEAAGITIPFPQRDVYVHQR